LDKLDQQLADCFSIVFPGLDSTEIAMASMETFAEWDSLKTLTLMMVIEEEIGLNIPVEEFESLTSYQLLLAYLAAATGAVS
jgi:acyl carrier protein